MEPTQTIRRYNNTQKNIWEKLNAYFHLIGQIPNKERKKRGRESTNTRTARKILGRRYLERYRWMHRQLGDSISVFLFFHNNEICLEWILWTRLNWLRIRFAGGQF
jgi:hypothetical protein